MAYTPLYNFANNVHHARRWWMWQPITDTLQFATASSEKEDVPFTLLLHTRYFQGCHLTKWQKRGCAAWNNQAAQVIPQLQHERDSRFHEIDGMGQVPRSVWRWKKEHLLVTTVSKKVAASIRSGNCKENIQAVEVNNFMKSIHPHWISSLANNIVGPSGDGCFFSWVGHFWSANGFFSSFLFSRYYPFLLNAAVRASKDLR